MQGLLLELRHAARGLARRPGFTLLAAVTLGLGVGAASTMFAALDQIVLRPLDFPSPGRLAFLNESSPDGSQTYSVSLPNFRDWREQTDAFSSLSAFRADSFNLTGTDEPVRVRAGMVSGDFFATLGASAELGRFFTAEEEDDRLAVLSHGFWQSRLGGRTDAVGAELTLDGRSFTVVGVLPEGFEFLTSLIEVWVPLGVFREELPWNERGRHPGLWVVGRLAPGMSLQQARARMAVVAEAIDEIHDHPHPVVVTPLHERSVGRARAGLESLMGSALLLLLVACINVANLLIARASERGREMTTRVALGASRRRLAVQLVIESLMLSALGGFVGLLASSWGVDLLKRLLPASTPRVEALGLDGATFGFTLAAALATGVLFGLAPLAEAERRSLAPGLASGRGLVSGRRRLPRVLVVAEVGLAAGLLVVTGLLVKSFFNVSGVDAGFRVEQRVAARLALPASRYAGSAEAEIFYQELLTRLEASPDVASAAVGTGLPLVDPGIEAGVWSRAASVAGDEVEEILASVQLVSPSYFDALGVELLQGRALGPEDRASSRPVAVVDELLARRLFPGRSAIGEAISVGGTPEAPGFVEIVGVAHHVRNYQLDALQYPEVYLPLDQPPVWFDGLGDGNLVVRHRGRPEAAIASIRRAVAAIDPTQPIYGASTLADVVALELAPRRANGVLTASFALAALALAAIGLYGVVSGLVASRTRELGLRLALGATPRGILALVAGEGMKLGLGGIALGLLVAGALFELLRSSLYGVSVLEPDVLVMALAVVLASTLAACVLPARRATRIETTKALRCD